MKSYKNSQNIFKEALNLLPGGVNSPVRAFKSVDGDPIVMKKGFGPYLFDVDDNKYIDYVLSWGPLVLGHSHPDVVSSLHKVITQGTSYGAPTEIENKLAKFIISKIDSIQMIRFVNSGTEACMSALRLARAYTKKTKIIKFAGNYHGHADMFLLEAGSGVATLNLPNSPGVPEKTISDSLVAQYNDIESVDKLFKDYPDEIAGVIIEPIAANMGFVLPEENFLKQLEELCSKNDSLLIFDEVMTGFRASPGGAQKLWNISPDITCLGKVIGGGLPVGAYGGKKEIMKEVSPSGEMYQAGTLSGNPLAMTAGYQTLESWSKDNVFEKTEKNVKTLVEGIEIIAREHNIPIQVNYMGTMFGFYFLKSATDQIKNYESAKQYADIELFGKFHKEMIDKGIYLPPSQFEANFMSSSHSKTDIKDTLEAINFVFNKLGKS
tara:strand:+ start:7496 stop:8803 length:1308 start_codon:yes stop_codon:yes gene_type:complete